MKHSLKRIICLAFFFNMPFLIIAQGNMQQREAEYYFLQGMKLFVLEDYIQAIAKFQVALSFDKENDGIQYQLAQAYARTGDYEAAIEYTEKALAQETQNPYYYLQLAHFYQNIDEKEKTIEAYESLIENITGQEKYYEDIAQIYVFSEKYSKAQEAYQKLEQSTGQSENITQRKLQVYLMEGDSKKALSEVQKLVIFNPEEVSYQIMLAELLIENKEKEKAIEVLENNANSENPDLRALRLLTSLQQDSNAGEENSGLKQLQKAVNNPNLGADEKISLIQDFFKKEEGQQDSDIFLTIAANVFEQHPESAKANAFYGDMLLVKNDNEGALEKYRAAVNLDETFIDAWYQVVRLEDELEMYVLLEEDAALALEIFPNQSVFWLYQGVAFLNLGNYEEAIFYFEEAQRLSVGNENMKDDLDLLKAEAYIYQENYSTASQLIEEVLSKKQGKAQAFFLQSYLLASQKKDLNKALKIAEDLVEDSPQNTRYLHLKAWVLYQQKDFEQAKEVFEVLITQDPKRGLIWERYGDTLFQLGQLDMALENWKMAKIKGRASDFIDKKINNQQLYEQ